MSRRLLFTLAMITLFGVNWTYARGAAGQVIHSDSFETDPASLGWRAPSPPAKEWVEGIARSGSHSLRIHVDPGQNIKWRQTCAIPVKANVKYCFSVWVRCKDVLDHWGVNVSIYLKDGGGTGYGNILGHDGWREIRRYFTPTVDTEVSGMSLGLAGENDLDWGYETGPMTAWFDDVTITDTGLDMSAVPANSVAEKRAYSNQSWWNIVGRFKKAVEASNEGWVRAELERANRQLMKEQFYPDGGQIEASPHYHMVTMRSAMRVMTLARKRGIELPEGFTEKLPGAITDFFVGILTPQLRLPLVGDNGDDHIHDVRDMVRLFGRADCEWVWKGRRAGTAPQKTSVAFPDSGFYVMRSDWSPDAHYLLFRCVDHHGHWYWHFHRDQLTFLLYVFGQPIIMERGGWGDGVAFKTEDFRRTEFHNAMMLDGKQQNYLESTCHTWLSNAVTDFVDGSQPGYQNATCRRRIFFVKSPDKQDAYFVMSDVITGAGERVIKQFLHFDPAIEISSPDDGGAIIAANAPGRAHLVPPPPSRDGTYVDNVPIEQTPRSGVTITIQDRRGARREWKREEGRLCIASPDSSLSKSAKHYNLPSPSVSWQYSGALPIGSHLVFQPFAQKDALPAQWQVHALPMSDPQADGILVTRGLIKDIFCFATERGLREYGEVTCDGTAAFVRMQGEQPTRLTLINGTTLSIGDLRVSSEPAGSFSLIRAGANWLPADGESLHQGNALVTIETALGKKSLLLD